ncbi:uncharacterized protein ACRADG_000883 [Cochliomyia hominivorax]
MTSSLAFYLKPKFLPSITTFEDNDIFANEDEEEDDDDFDNQGYIQEVPYTSSSVDRSSIGSIPWADDAIKINKLEWEKVEKMLSGLEAITNEEDDLSKEILDWQKKFPQLLNGNKVYKMKHLSNDSLDIETLPSLEQTSDEEAEIEDKTLTRHHVADISVIPPATIRKSSEEDSNNLCHLMDNFTLKSVPLKLNQRETTRAAMNKRKCASSTSSYSLRSPPTPIQQVPLAPNITSSRFRMPPILNVLDSRRKFRSLSQSKNQSFVQLTQIQQAKSAVVSQEQKSRTRFHTGHRSAWHVPLAANRFFNNRNSIILPSLSGRQPIIQQYSTQPTTSTTSEMGTSNTTPLSSGPRTNNNFTTQPLTTKRQFFLGDFSTNASSQTNTSNTTTSGRSISAAVQYPRVHNYNALYLPYSASKFHAFK